MISGVRFVCISLVGAQERRNRMAEQFTRLNMQVEFFDAIEPDAKGYTSEVDYDANHFDRFVGRQMTRGEVGCYRSHVAVFKQIAASGLPFACVIEDDVLLDPDFLTVVESLLAMPADWDLVRLAGVFERRLGQVVGRLPCGRALVDFLEPPRGTQAYLVRAEAIAPLLAHLYPVRYPIDDAIDRYWEHGLRISALRPWVAREDRMLPSTIGARRAMRVSIAVKVRREARRFAEDCRRVMAFLRRWIGRRLC